MTPPVNARATLKEAKREASAFFALVANALECPSATRSVPTRPSLLSRAKYMLMQPVRWLSGIPRRSLIGALRRGSRNPIRFSLIMATILFVFMAAMPNALEFFAAISALSPALATLRFVAESPPQSSGSISNKTLTLVRAHRKRLLYIYWLTAAVLAVLDSTGCHWFALGPRAFYTFLKSWLLLWMHWFSGAARVYETIICPFAKAKEFPQDRVFELAARNVDETLNGTRTKTSRSSVTEFKAISNGA